MLELSCALCFWVSLPVFTAGQTFLHEESHAIYANSQGWNAEIHLGGPGGTIASTTYRLPESATASQQFLVASMPRLMDLGLFAVLFAVRHIFDLPPWLDSMLLAWQTACVLDFTYNTLGIFAREKDWSDAWSTYRALNGSNDKSLPLYKAGSALAVAGLVTALVVQW